jgi:DnaJ-class molecular chaperone
MAKQDYYTVLGIRRDASAKEIKQAYRRLARKYHPDVNPGDVQAEQKFKEISEAYSVLENPDSRKKYDQFGHHGFAGSFDSAFGRGGGSQGTYTDNLRDFFGGRGGFSESFGSLFEDFFGGGKQRARAAAQRDKDIEQTVEIGFEEAVRGATIQVQVPRPNGNVERLQVKIPPGVANGSKIRLAGKGKAHSNGAPGGDLYIVTRIRPHAFFSRDGHDIMCELPLALGEMLFGAKVQVPTIDGTTTMTIPAGTQNGRTFRLRGKGVPHLKESGRGDQYVKVVVVLPEHLDDRSRDLMEEFCQRNPQTPRAHMGQ